MKRREAYEWAVAFMKMLNIATAWLCCVGLVLLGTT